MLTYFINKKGEVIEKFSGQQTDSMQDTQWVRAAEGNRVLYRWNDKSERWCEAWVDEDHKYSTGEITKEDLPVLFKMQMLIGAL